MAKVCGIHHPSHAGCIFDYCVCFCQSYSMRNSVLGVLGEMLVRVLSKEDLDDKLKSTRNQFLDKLEVCGLMTVSQVQEFIAIKF